MEMNEEPEDCYVSNCVLEHVEVLLPMLQNMTLLGNRVVAEGIR